MCSDFNISKDVLKTVLRAPVMSLTHSFFEKTFRIQKICQSYKYLKVPAIEKNKTPETIEQLNEIIVSKQYNLLLINSIAKTFSDFDEYSYTGEKLNKKKYKYKNNLFELQSGLNLFARFVAKLDYFTNMRPALGRFPVLTLANAEPAFSKNFFYWFNFKKVNMSWVYTHVDLDIKLRQKIFCDGLVESQLIKIFSSFFKFSDPHCRKLTCAFLENFMFHFPKQLFEGLNQNINFASRILCGFNNKNLICSTGLSDTKTIFLLSAARKNGFNSEYSAWRALRLLKRDIISR
jgi:hypothetical protein